MKPFETFWRELIRVNKVAFVIVDGRKIPISERDKLIARYFYEQGAAQLARLRGPVGLYIGSRTPPEIAVSILAEVIAAKNGVEWPAAVHVAEAKDAISAPAGAAVCGTPVEHS